MAGRVQSLPHWSTSAALRLVFSPASFLAMAETFGSMLLADAHALATS